MTGVSGRPNPKHGTQLRADSKQQIPKEDCRQTLPGGNLLRFSIPVTIPVTNNYFIFVNMREFHVNLQNLSFIKNMSTILKENLVREKWSIINIRA